MKALKNILVALLIGLSYFTSHAQRLPQPSPKAEVKQILGLTNFSLEYSRPGVKGRVIWGDLVPYDQNWRTGANRATLLRSTSKFIFGGVHVPPGTYALYTIPGTSSWTVILNSDTTLWGAEDYDPELNVAEAEVKPRFEENSKERLELKFNALEDSTMNLSLSWERLRLDVPIEVSLMSMASENIEMALADSPDDYPVPRNAAVFYKNMGHYKRALDYANNSLEINPESWYTHYIIGEIFEEMGQCREALEHGMTAMRIGLERAEESGEAFAYEKMVTEKIELWRSPDCQKKIENREQEKREAESEPSSQEEETGKKKKKKNK